MFQYLEDSKHYRPKIQRLHADPKLFKNMLFENNVDVQGFTDV